LTTGNVYKFRVAAVNAAGTGPWNVETLPVDTGNEHTCAVLEDATVVCWGGNSYGQLGDGTNSDSLSPVYVSGINGATPATSAVAVVTGTDFSCALMGDGSVKCWGDNSSGQLGAGLDASTVYDSNSPLPVVGIDGSAPGATATALTAGSYTACAVLVDGAVWCWGSNTSGQLGDGSTTDSNVPVPVNDIIGSGNTNSGFSISSIFGSTIAVSVDAYADTTCAVMSDGALYCWGSNSYGQLGDGTTNDSSSPVQVTGIDGSTVALSATIVSVGAGFVCAVVADGAVKCWGKNSAYELGDESEIDSTTPILLPLLDGSTPDKTVVSLAGGFEGMCALTAIGQPKCWGTTADLDGALGRAKSSAPESIISATPAPFDVAGFAGSVFEKIATGVVRGDRTSCVLLVEGSLKCWGYNGSGQLGDGTTTDASTPVAVVLPGLSVDTLLRSRPFTFTKPVNTPSSPSRVTTSSATGSSLDVSWTAPISDGGVAISDYTIDYRKRGEVAWSTYTHTASTATSVTVDGLDPSTTYQFRVAAVNSAGTGPWSVVQSVAVGDGHTCAVMVDGTVQCWGSNFAGQLGDGSGTDSYVPVAVSGISGLTPATTAVSVSIGMFHSCALMADGSVQCWGRNSTGELGDGTTNDSLVPVSASGITGLTPGSTAVSVSVGLENTCALMANGTLQCWGYNRYGAVGDGTAVFVRSVPVVVSGITGSSTSSTAVRVSVGSTHACAVMADGSVQCWGFRARFNTDSGWGAGILGHGDTYGSRVPVLVSGISGLTASTSAVSVSSGDVGSCASMADGTVQCWGDNTGGNLGDGTTNESLVPVLVSGITGSTGASTSVSVSVGWSHSCALMVGGTAECWGTNLAGNLGDGTTNDSLVPVSVSGFSGASAATAAMSVSAGSGQTCALTADGDLQCWGDGLPEANPGDGSLSSSLVPVPISAFDGSSAATRVAGIAEGRTLALSPPSAPLRVTTSNATSTTLDVAWVAPISSGSTAISDYEIEYRKVGAVTWSTVSHAASTATFSEVTGLDSDSPYEFRVAAVNTDGTGPWSARETTLGVGSTHTCVVIGDGTIQCWGDNASGQLGNNTTIDSSVPVLVDGIYGATTDTTAVTVSTGQAATCSLMADGTVKCWGENGVGQLGNGSTTSSSVPVLVSGITGLTPETTAVQVSVGRYHMCALMADGTLLCWGDNGNGQLGDNSITNSTTPVVVSGIDGLTAGSTATSVSVYGSHSCALIADGTVKCWGFNSYGNLGNNSTTDSSVPVSVSGIDGNSDSSTAVGVSLGFDNSCVVMANGTVRCWGWNSSGQLGNNSTTNSSTPVAVSGLDASSAATTAVSVDAGDIHVCAVMMDSSVKCWGGNYAGQLGNATSIDSLVPVIVSGIAGGAVEAALSVSAGTAHTCALMVSGAVKCWGKNDDGQLGDTSTLSSKFPVDVGGFPGATNATSPSGSSFGRTLGVVPTAPLHVVTSTPTLTSLDVSWTLPLSDGGSPITDYTIEYRKIGASLWTAVSHTPSTATTITVTGLDSDSTYEFRVAAVNANGASEWTRQLTAFAVGSVHTCALVSDGSAACWGRNNFGQLGNGSTTNARVPGPVTGLDGSTPAKTAVALASGEFSSCALLADGAVKCWGRNNSGQLGNGTYVNSTTPVAVSGFDGLTPATSAVSISTFGIHVCALRADGSVACWGGNMDGQLGNGTTTNSNLPVAVSGLDGSTAGKTAVSITTGPYNSCVLLATAAVKCWGNNMFGQLGDGTVTSRLTPTPVSGLTGTPGVVQVSAGRASACVVFRDGSAKCWGDNADGRLGDGSNTRQLTPVAVFGLDGSTPATTVRSISVGGQHACANLADGSAVCWGDNTYSQLGGLPFSSNQPAPVTGIDGSTSPTSAVLLTTGELHTCAVLADGSAVCWGMNFYGQLGDGSANSSAVPVDVTGLSGSTPASSLPWNLGIGSTLVPLPETPSAPLYVTTSTATTTSLDVSWSEPVSIGSAAISDYTIEYRKVGEISWTTVLHTASTATSITVTGLDSDSSYEFRVSAVNSVGVGPASMQATGLDAGASHSCALLTNGRVRCWGQNNYGQVGDGTNSGRNAPTLVSGITGLSDATTAVDVAIGFYQSCALMGDGVVQCWGRNEFGQLGIGSTTNSNVPVQVNGITGLLSSNTAVAISPGREHTCALMGNGTVQCWGRNNFGQLGDNSITDRSVPVLVSGIDGLTLATTAVSVSSGGWHTCALMANNAVKCWGKNWDGQLGDNSTTSSLVPLSVVGINGVSASSTAVTLSLGMDHSCAAMANGTVKCWGSNSFGQLGDNTTTRRLVPTQVVGIDGTTPSTTAVSVASGDAHTCVVMANATVMCWGLNANGRLGDGTTTDSRVPVVVLKVDGASPSSAAVAVKAGSSHTCALAADGTVLCWGWNGHGQLGKSGGDSSKPVRSSAIDGVTPVTSARATSSFGRTLAIVVPSAPLHVVTSNATSTSLDLSWTVPVFDGRAAITDYTIEYRKVGELNWTAVVHTASTATSITVTGLDSDSSYVFRVAAVNSAGTGPWSGQEPTVDSAESHSCAVMADGTVQCWGFNGSGQLGDNSTVTSQVPVLVSGISGLSPSDTAVSVTTGGSHSCALMADGTVRCWGFNGSGQVGNNTTTNALVPVSVSGITGATAATTAISVSAGTWHSCAVMADGSVRCWGKNEAGALGDNTTTDSLVPVLVLGLDGSVASSLAVSVSAGRNYSCTLLADGTVQCWGYSGGGQLGDGTTTSSSVPVSVSGITGLSASTTAVGITAGDYQTCAVMADGAVQCWGLNNWGQLGDGTFVDKYVPTGVLGVNGLSASTTAVSASAGSSHTCAVMADDSTSCWGDNRLGQLGDGTSLGSSVPVAVSGLPGLLPSSEAVGVGIGQDYSCAVMADGTVKCWGQNTYGQLGNGTTINQSAPVVVSSIDGNTTSARVAVSSPLSRGRTLGKAPSAPLHVVTSSPTLTAIDVSWTEPACVGDYPISDYTIEYRKVGGLSWTTVSHTASTATSITVMGLDPSSTYEFRVAAVNAGGTGLWNVQQIDVDAGGKSSCALMADGTVHCWGFNGDGQLGNNSNTDSLVPVSVTGITGVSASSTAVSVSAGDSHACAVMADGTVQCWGLNWAGELGDNSTNNSSVPVQVSGITGLTAASTAVEVSAGYWHTCALMADGSVKCWGYNGDGALGDNSTNDSPVPVLVSGIDGATSAAVASGVSVGYWHSCARMANGTVQCWGKGSEGRLGNNSTADSPVPVNVSGITGLLAASSAVGMSAGTAHTCAVMADGAVQCWGKGSEGRLGNNSTADSPVPVQVSGFTGLSTAATAVSVSSGGSHSCSLMGNGGVRCWGDNFYGRLGNNSTTNSTVPVQVFGFTGATDATTAVSVTAGDGHSCSVMADRTVKCWGVNQAGQLGDNTIIRKSVPVPVMGIDGLTTPTSARLSSSFGHTLVFVPGAPLHVVTSAATLTSLDVSWMAPIFDGGSAITDYTIEYRKVGELSWTVVTRMPSTVTSMTVNGLDSDSTYEFRVAAVNSVGTGPWSGREITVDTGTDNACALMVDGTVQCWGWNNYGQLGNGSTTDSSVPVLVSGITGLTPATTAERISAGSWHSCAVMADGSVQCWGANNYGQLGDGSTFDSPVPVSVSGITGLTPATTAISVTADYYHSCAVMADGTAQCWGWNNWGQLGDALTTDSSVPVLVSGITGLTPGNTAVSASAGYSHSCVVMADGTAQCWGFNEYGQLGDGSTIDSVVPVLVSGITGLTPDTAAVSVTAGASYSCVLMVDGTVQCWGANWGGRLGDGSTTDSSVPVVVSGITGLTPATTAVSVYVGGVHVCAVMADDTAQCWGANSDGQLGDDSTADSSVPVVVSGISGLTPATAAVSTTSGASHSCAVMADGTVQCWGLNARGQLGDGTTTNSGVPLAVSGIDGQRAATTVRTPSFGRTLGPVSTSPSAPLYVQTSSASSTSLDLSWLPPTSSGSTAVIDYTIEYRQAGESSWSTFSHTASTLNFATVNGLTPDTQYEFRVAAVNSDGQGPWSRENHVIGSGQLYSCAVMATGAVQCWGSNITGELGNGSNTHSASPVLVSGIDGVTGGTTAVAVSTGYQTACAVMDEATVKCWGAGLDGQLGNGVTASSNVPVSVSGLGTSIATAAVRVSVGRAAACALLFDGSVRCWGSNAFGKLGNGTTINSSVPVQVSGITGATPATTAVSVSLGDNMMGGHACALMGDGTVRCWGFNSQGTLGNGTTTDSNVPVLVSAISGNTAATTAVSVSAGASHSCAVMGDGTVLCWGANLSGQLGNGTTISSSVPVPVSGITGLDAATTAVAVSTGDSATCVLLADGGLRCWGSNWSGQLGDGSTTNSPLPVSVSGIEGVGETWFAAGIGVGVSHSCAVIIDGTARCWGNNFRGALGDGTTTVSNVPVVVSGIDGQSAATTVRTSSFGRTLAVVVSPSGPSAPLHVKTSDETLRSMKVSWIAPVWNDGSPITNYKVQYRKFGATTWKTFAHRPSTAKSITVGGLDSATTYEFRVAAVNSVGTSPWSVQESTAQVGDSHTCAVTVDGEVKCWGWNMFGQLGDDSTTDSDVPVAVHDLDGSGALSTAVSVASGVSHSCAVMVNGTVKCWGKNDIGQLGDETTTDSRVPVPVSGITGLTPATTAVSVTAGGGSTCALMAKGTVKCWGHNDDGQLGNGSNSGSSTPVVVRGIDGSSASKTAVTVHITASVACALMANGTVLCWGRNNFGQLGDNSRAASNVPVAVSGITGSSAASTAVSVSAGGYHSCALMANGAVQCWGSNLHGQLGDTLTAGDSLIPVLVSGIDGLDGSAPAVSVSAGTFHACAVMVDGTVACWGWNMNGTLGNNSLVDSSVPVLVSGPNGSSPASSASVVSAGGFHSCALMKDASLKCWGYNAFGQLGDGSTLNGLSAMNVTDLDGANNSRSVRQASTGTTLADSLPPERPLLSRPTPVAVIDRDADSIAIRWGVPADKGGKHIDSYRVNYRIKGSSKWTDSATVRYSQLRLQVNGLKSGVTYEFQVRAHNANGFGDPSRVVAETVPVRAPAPVVVQKIWQRRVITLTWRAVQTPSHSPVIAYVMSCQVDDGKTFRARVAPDKLTASVKVPTTQLYSCRVAGVTDAGRGFGSERAFVSDRIQDGKQR